MASSAFNLSSVCKTAQAEWQGNANGNGRDTFYFTAAHTGVAIITIVCLDSGSYFAPNITKNGEKIAEATHNGGNSFSSYGFSYYQAKQYGGGFASREIAVKKGDQFAIYGGAWDDSGRAKTVTLNFFVVK